MQRQIVYGAEVAVVTCQMVDLDRMHAGRLSARVAGEEQDHADQPVGVVRELAQPYAHVRIRAVGSGVRQVQAGQIGRGADPGVGPVLADPLLLGRRQQGRRDAVGPARGRLRRSGTTRAVAVTPGGRESLRTRFGIAPA